MWIFTFTGFCLNTFGILKVKFSVATKPVNHL